MKWNIFARNELSKKVIFSLQVRQSGLGSKNFFNTRNSLELKKLPNTVIFVSKIYILSTILKW